MFVFMDKNMAGHDHINGVLILPGVPTILGRLCGLVGWLLAAERDLRRVRVIVCLPGVRV